MDRSALQASLQKPDVRQLIKFHVLLRKSPSETHSVLKEGLEDFCPSYETVRKWHNLFSHGTIDAQDAPRSGRPKTASDEDHVERVRDLVERIVVSLVRKSLRRLASAVSVFMQFCETIFTSARSLPNGYHTFSMKSSGETEFESVHLMQDVSDANVTAFSIELWLVMKHGHVLLNPS